MGKKKTTRVAAASKPRTRRRKADTAETPLLDAPATEGGALSSETVAADAAPLARTTGESGRKPRRPRKRPAARAADGEHDEAEHEPTIALDPHDDEPPAAEVSDVAVARKHGPAGLREVAAPVSPGAQVQRDQNAIVIRFPSARPPQSAPAPKAPTEPPARPRPPAPSARQEDVSEAKKQPDLQRRGQRPPEQPRGEPAQRSPRHVETPIPRPGGELTDVDTGVEARLPADASGQDPGEEGARRRRRRRRRGRRGRGNGEGAAGVPPVVAKGAPKPQTPPRNEPRTQMPGPAHAEPRDRRPAADEADERGLSQSQKRRRRRRGRGRGGERTPVGDAPVASPDSTIEAMKAELAAEQEEAVRHRGAAPSPVDRDPPVELDDDEIEHIDERDAPEEAVAESGPDEKIDAALATEPREEAERLPREDDRRGPRGRRGRRNFRGRRREFGESDDADSRVYGEEIESPAVEISPEDQPAGLETLAEGAEAPTRAAAKRKEMIINIAPNEECRIAVLEDGKLEQIYLERASAESHVGNIYKGLVTNVEPSIQAAFIDFGLGKNGFLHISDLHPKFFPNGGDASENIGRKLPRKARPPIQKCLRRGQELIVQITKEGIGTKGPTLTTYLSIPGRFMVMMPGAGGLGVSRKIEDEELRRKLRSQMNDLELPSDIGFIARTAAEDRSSRELQSDLNYLTRLWRAVEKRIDNEPAPAELYRDSDLVIRTIRDVFAADVHRVIVDDAEVAKRAAEFLAIFSPKARDTVEVYEGTEPIFHKYGIEAELERLHSRHVPLRSGGSLVIDQTEALVAIDVNSGRFRQEDDAELTAYKINCEAADEIPRQLRLRDLGGVIICDFIDLRREEHRREIEKRLIKNLKQHKERAKVLRMSQFGIIEMTRQRQRASLTRSVYQDCHHCRGSGLVKTGESVALDVMRLIQLSVTREHIRAIEVAVSPEVAYLLQNRKRSVLHEIESQYGKSISIKPEAQYSLDYVQINCFDHRGRLVPHP